MSTDNGQGNSGSGSGGDSGGIGNETPFTEAQKQEMIRIQNAANSAHHSRITKVMEQRFDELRTAMAAEFSEMLKGIKPAAPDGNQGQGKGAGNADVEKVRAEYEARMSELEKKVKLSEQKRQEEHDRNLRHEERSKLETALRAAGIADERVRPAVALLYTEDQRVGRAKDNSVVFRVQRDGYVDDLPLDQGVEEWLKTPEGKHFAPSREVRGSGATGGASQRTSNGKPTKQELKRDLVAAVLAAERGQ